MTDIILKNCPRCENEAAKDFEEKMIYCTGCPLSVHDVYMDFKSLSEIWNSLREQISQ